MTFVLAAAIALASTFGLASESFGQDQPVPRGPLGIGMEVGAALLILLAALIGLSVVAKLLIVFGAVPRRPETAVHGLVHAFANFVGALARPKPRRRSDR